MEYTPISQLKQRFGSPFNSINISLAAVNRKTQLERERKREKRRECFTTICLTLLKLEDLKLDTRKSVKKKIARIPPKDIHQFQEMQFFAIPKTVSKRLLGFEGGWTTSTHVGFSLVEPDGHTSTQFHYPFTDSSRWFKVLFLVILGYHPHQYVHRKPSQAWWLRSHIFSSQAVEFVKEQLSLSFLMSRKRSTGILNTSLLYLQGEIKWAKIRPLMLLKTQNGWSWLKMGKKKKSWPENVSSFAFSSLFSGQQATLIWGKKKGESVTSKSLGFGRKHPFIIPIPSMVLVYLIYMKTLKIQTFMLVQ